jgi:hypothetical protein
VAELIQEGRHLTEEGILEIQNIKAGMNSGRTFVSKLEYMNSIKDHMIITPAWLSGFIDGEGHLAPPGVSTNLFSSIHSFELD